MCHMWTAPDLQEFFDDFDRISCVRMSGLLVRSHLNAGQDGFRDVGSKRLCCKLSLAASSYAPLLSEVVWYE